MGHGAAIAHSDVGGGGFLVWSFPQPRMQRVDKPGVSLAFLLLNTAHPSSLRRVFALLPVSVMQQ